MTRLPWPLLVLGGVFLAAACSSSPDGQPAAPGFDAVAAELARVIEHEMEAKGLPAVSIALVSDQRIVWSRGFGVADADRETPATSRTMYRVGSVSKLFTDIGVMQLVERGELDLDAPVRRYVPEFDPGGPGADGITLRQLTSHRSGIVREPPIGNYFEDGEPTLAATVQSLRGTGLIYPVGTQTKYSNAGIAVVGYTLEKTQQEPFASYLKRNVLDRLGMTDCAFEKTPAIERRLAKAVMWRHDGREFVAPTFELGMAPAGSLYASVDDLGKFLKAVFRGGGDVLKPATLEQMLTAQDGSGYGIGFRLKDFDGHRWCGHGGAIYGFATQLAFLPDEKLGVAVVTSVDCANAVMRRISDLALQLMLAQRAGQKLPTLRLPGPVDDAVAKRAVGRYRSGDRTLDITRSFTGLQVFDGASQYVLRQAGDTLVIDDRHRISNAFQLRGDGTLTVGATTFSRVDVPCPPPPPKPWMGLIGEYGWDHNVLYVHERDGHLYALLEWFEFDRLTEISRDVFAFPARGGMYHGERLEFDRDANGVATQARIGRLVFKRRPVGLAEGDTFRIEPVAPVDEIRKGALAATPPPESKPRKPDLVDVAQLDATIKLDIRYATTNNFMSTVFYKQPRAFLQRPAAHALVRAHRSLAKHGYGILIHDAYRPWFVTKMFWDATPQEQKLFVADPSQGSRHNRGCAADITLYELATGKVVHMIGGYDEFTDRSFADYSGGTSRQRWHRDLLRRTMEAHGFSVYEWEWWHFDFQDWREYPILNLTFEEL